MEGVQVVPTQRQSHLQGIHGSCHLLTHIPTVNGERRNRRTRDAEDPRWRTTMRSRNGVCTTVYVCVAVLTDLAYKSQLERQVESNLSIMGIQCMGSSEERDHTQ